MSDFFFTPPTLPPHFICYSLHVCRGLHLRFRCHARSPWAMAFWSTSCGLRRPLSDAAGPGRAEQTRRCGPSVAGAAPASHSLSLHPLFKTPQTGGLPHRSIARSTASRHAGFFFFPPHSSSSSSSARVAFFVCVCVRVCTSFQVS